MRLLCLAAFAFLLFSATPAFAVASPSSNIQGNSCSQLGATLMATDQTGLLACLRLTSGSNTLIWKPMTPVIGSPDGKIGIANTDPGSTVDVGTLVTFSDEYNNRMLWGTGFVRAARFKTYNWDATYDSIDSMTGKYYQLIGTYHGWDPDSIYIGGYNAADQPANGYSAGASSVSMGGYRNPGGPTMFVNFMNRRVGVNTTQPQTSLDVNGELRVSNSGVSCSSTNEGAMRYNRTTKVFEGCNGSLWQALGDVPSGSLCGLAVSGTDIGTDSKPCMGMNVMTSCPTGYIKINMMSAVGNMAGSYYIASCMKN